MSNSVLAQVPACLAPYARKLTHEEPDFNGILLSSGTNVLSLKPGDPIYEFTDRNANEPGYQAILSAATYPLMVCDEVNVLLSRKMDFCARIEANFSERNLLRRAFPYAPTAWHVLPENVGPGIRRIEEIADFSAELLAAMTKALVGANSLVAPPQAWTDQMKTLTAGKIWRVTSASLFSRCAYVVEAFAVPCALNPESGCVGPADATAELLLIVRACARQCLANVSGDVFYAIGSGCKAGVGFAAPRKDVDFVTLSSPAANGGWKVDRSDYLRSRTSYRDFCDRLMPLTEDELLSEVRKIVDPLVLNPGMFRSGAAFVRRDIIPALRQRYPDFPDIRQTAVIGVLRQMRGENPRAYAIMRNAKREIFVASPPGRILPGDRPYRKLSWFMSFMVYYFFYIVCWTGCIVCTYVYKNCGKDVGWTNVLSFLIVPTVLSYAIRRTVRRIAVAERN